MLNLIVILVFTCVALAVLGAVQLRQRRRLRDVIGIGESGSDQSPTDAGRESFLDRFERMALQAGLGWSRQTYFAMAGGGAALGALLALTGHGAAAAAVAAAGLLGPNAYVRRTQTKRADRFAQQLPQALFLGASVLRAGGTLLQAVDAIAEQMPDPLGAEFRRIQQQMRLQIPAHEAMAEAMHRVGVREFAAVVVAARITAEVGGNLALLFDDIARSIVEAQNARRAVQSYTTEGRMSANLIAALPFVVMGLLQFLSPGYFRPLFAWPGVIILGLCVGMIILGWTVIRRMVDIRIY